MLMLYIAYVIMFEQNSILASPYPLLGRTIQHGSLHFLTLLIFLLRICSDASSGGGGDFVAGFLLGGAVFGTLAYIFAPQVVEYYLPYKFDTVLCLPFLSCVYSGEHPA